MTATLLSRDLDLFLGRRLRDCDDGQVLIVVAVDDNGDFEVIDENTGCDEGRIWPEECHHEDEDHLPVEQCSDGLLLTCYAWIDGDK